MPRAHELPALALLLAALPGCDGCHGSRPYTPYTLGDSANAGGTPAPPGRASAGAQTGMAPGDGGPAFAPVAATAAPGDGKSWPMEGAAAQPPAGHAFAEGLVFDADGDQKADLVAWSRAPDGLRGELWFAPGKDPASGRALVALPADLAVPGCSPVTALTRIAQGMVVFDFDPRCGPRARERGARWIAVFRMVPGALPELGLEIRLGAPAEGETLAVAVDGRDRDGDGRGDLTATVTLSGAPRPLPSGGTASAQLAFFDRPAGLSRDPSEPEASLKTLASGLVADGRKRTTAPHVAAAAVAARRLHALLCEEAGKPAINTSAGPVHCGDLRLLEDAAMAEAEAAINLSDPFAAMAAIARLETRRKDMDGLLAKAIPSIPGKLAHAVTAVPDAAPAPAFAPFAFDKNGDLLVRTRDAVIRVDGTSFQEQPDASANRWPARLAWPAGPTPTWTLAAVEERCDAPTLVARLEAGGDKSFVPLPVLSPARCTPSTSVPADLLGTSAQGALLAVRGDVVAVPLEATPHPAPAESLGIAPGTTVEPGAARSPDGAVVALSTVRGILVATLKDQARKATARLWTAPSADGATACVPSTADRIACLVKGAAAIYDAK